MPQPLIYIYNRIACDVCSIIVWFADNVPPSLCSTSACAVQWRNVDAVRMRTLNKVMAARYQQENHVTRYPVILYRSVTTTRKQWQQLHVLTFLGGRESVCKIICAIGDCLDTSGRLEDLPGGLLFLVFGELTDRGLTISWRKCDHLSLDTVSCAWTTDGRIVCLLEDGRKDQGHSSARARCWHSVNWPILTLLLNYPARQEQCVLIISWSATSTI